MLHATRSGNTLSGVVGTKVEFLKKLHVRYYGYGWVLICGIAHIIIGTAILYLSIMETYSEDMIRVTAIIIAISLAMIILGCGLVFQKRWAYLPFKFGLYVNLLAFPIGTIFSLQMLKYIKENRILDCMH